MLSLTTYLKGFLSMALRIIVEGGTPNSTDAHLCERCAYYMRVRGTHMEVNRCRRLAISIRGRVSACSMFNTNEDAISGAGIESAHRLVIIAGYGPTFLGPGEFRTYEQTGDYPERFHDGVRRARQRRTTE